MEQMHQLFRRFLSLVRSYLDLCKCLFPVIRMEFLKESIFLIRRHSSRLYTQTLCSGGLHFLYGFHHFRCKHDLPSLFLDLSVVVKFLQLCDRFLHDLLNQLIVFAVVDLLDTLCKML